MIVARNTFVTLTTKPVRAISQTAARVSFAAATMFVVFLAALHLIKPEIDPSWRFISEYAIGDYGWIMALAFLSLALSFVALFIAIRSQVRTIGGRIGLALLLTSAAGLTMAAIFTTDPITASGDAPTTHGNLHNVAGTIGIGIPIAAALISWNLARTRAWSSARRSLLWVAVLVWISQLVFILSLGVMLSQSDGKFGPDVLIGWPNRLTVLAYSGWLMTVAWRAAQLHTAAIRKDFS